MKKSIFWFIFASIVLLTVVGCASIFTGTSQKVNIFSTPDNANVVIKDLNGTVVFQGLTPSEARLSRSSQYVVTVSLPGYQDAVTSINHNFNPVFLGNLICGGLLGMIIDFADGAVYDLTPNTLNIMLVTASVEGQADQKYAVLQIKDDQGVVHRAVTPLIEE